MEGRLVVGMNVHREICVLGMAGGVSVLPDQVGYWSYVCPDCVCVCVCARACSS